MRFDSPYPVGKASRKSFRFRIIVGNGCPIYSALKRGHYFRFQLSSYSEVAPWRPPFFYSLALNIYTCDRQTPIPFVIDETKTRDYYTEDQWNSIQVWNEATDGLYNMPRFGMSMTTEETNEYNAIYTDIDTYTKENIVRFIVGDKSFDEYDAFVDTLKQMGIEKCVELIAGLY